MIAYTKYLLFGFVMITAMACTKGDPADPPDGGVIGPACEDDRTCSGALGVCDVDGTKRCVECVAAPTQVENPSCAGNATGPVCGTGNTCRKCTAHSECTGSEVCAPEGVTDGATAVVAGTCIDTAKVAYADGAANPDNTACTKDVPCRTLQAAIDATSPIRPYVKATGVFAGAPSTSVIGKTVTIFAAPGTTLAASNNGDPALLVDKQGPNLSNLKVYDLQIIAPSGNGLVIRDKSIVDIVGGKISGVSLAGVAISNPMSKTTFTGTEISGNIGGGIAIAEGIVTVTSSMIKGNGTTGIEITNKGTAEITQSEVSENTGSGINLVDGELTLSRSTIRANRAGGVRVTDDKKFTITNNFIVGNIGNSGVNLGTPSTMSVFGFNTVVDNQDGDGDSDAGGVVCDGNPNFLVANSIVFRNVGGPNGMTQESGNCSYVSSYVVVGTGPTDSVLKFKNDTTDPRDYRLTAASPSGAAGVRDVPAAVCTGLTDVDGEARPKAGTCDLGADEL